MTIPDYGADVERVGGWIAAGANLVAGKTLFLEPELPKAPDTIATLFETGGVWNIERSQMVWRLLLVTRAPLLRDARALAVLALQSAVSGWMRSATAARGNIRNLKIAGLPNLQPRDGNNRVIQEAVLEMTIHAPFETGVDL